MDPSSSTSKTVPSLKSAFLRSQIRLLSAVLQPSSTWRDSPTNDPSSDSTPDIPQKTIDTVLTKLNAHLTSHNRSAYPPQTQLHIAEQIDALYWADVTSAGLHPSEPDEVDVGKDVDLSTPEGVDILPSQPAELFLHPEGGFEGQEAARYMALRARLEVAVAEQRKQRGRLEGYRRLKRLLEPFENAESEVQGNLVVKDGELGRELERLRVLVARVTGALGEMNESEGSRQTGDMGAGEEEDRREGRRDMLSEVMDVL